MSTLRNIISAAMPFRKGGNRRKGRIQLSESKLKNKIARFKIVIIIKYNLIRIIKCLKYKF